MNNQDFSMLIKIGGAILADDQLLESFAQDLKLLKQAGAKIVVVHGGGQLISEQLAFNNIESQFIEGQRVTSEKATKIIKLVMSGYINKMIANKLTRLGVKAKAMSADEYQLFECNYYSESLGFVGKIAKVNATSVGQHWSSDTGDIDTIPVIAPIGIDNTGKLLNINADHAASHLATALGVDKLIYLTDQEGILSKQGQQYFELTDFEIKQLIADETVVGGMLVKTKEILSALKKVNNIHILNGKKKSAISQAILSSKPIGTVCKTSQQAYFQEAV